MRDRFWNAVPWASGVFVGLLLVGLIANWGVGWPPLMDPKLAGACWILLAVYLEWMALVNYGANHYGGAS